MFPPTQFQRIASRLRTIQIISAAIIFGALSFGLVIGMTVDWKAVTGEVKMLTLLGAMTGFMLYGISLIVPRLITASTTQIAAELMAKNAQQTDQDDSIIDSLLSNFTVNRTMFFAFVEGAIFLNLITFKLEVSAAALVVLAIGFILLIVTFPFNFRSLSWLETNQRLVKDEMKLMK